MRRTSLYVKYVIKISGNAFLLCLRPLSFKNKLERKSGCRKMSCRMTVYCDPKEAFFMHFFMHFIVTNGSIWIDKWKNRECHFEKQMFTKFNQEDNSTKSAPFMFNNVIFRALIRFFLLKTILYNWAGRLFSLIF